ncbi:MAG TPA: helix-turn-helix domain-containing protein [Ignavibacteriales bacterium]|nr:helix-turn-helix domain-containing protein [Ignavibacteriales bacterium]
MENLILGQKIGKIREKLNYTQEDLGKYLGIDRTNLSKYETGERDIPMIHLEKLADLFGVDLYDLMNNEMDELNISLAYRADNLDPNDLRIIGDFKKIAKNYIKILNINARNRL